MVDEIVAFLFDLWVVSHDAYFFHLSLPRKPIKRVNTTCMPHMHQVAHRRYVIFPEEVRGYQ